MKKICTICKVEKDTSEFYACIHRTGKPGFVGACKPCYVLRAWNQKQVDRPRALAMQRSNWQRVSKHTKRKQCCQIKIKAVEYLGKKCIKCGYSKNRYALEFHHREPCKKEFNISTWLMTNHCKPLDYFKSELDKCDLLCANCHRELHHPEENISSID